MYAKKSRDEQWTPFGGDKLSRKEAGAVSAPLEEIGWTALGAFALEP